MTNWISFSWSCICEKDYQCEKNIYRLKTVIQFLYLTTYSEKWNFLLKTLIKMKYEANKWIQRIGGWYHCKHLSHSKILQGRWIYFYIQNERMNKQTNGKLVYLQIPSKYDNINANFLELVPVLTNFLCFDCCWMFFVFESSFYFQVRVNLIMIPRSSAFKLYSWCVRALNAVQLSLGIS